MPDAALAARRRRRAAADRAGGRAPLRVPLPRSLTTKLALLFFGVTLIAISVVYFVIVPALETNLSTQRLRDLERVALANAPPLDQAAGREVPASALDRLVRSLADESGAVVTLFGAQRSGGEAGAEEGRVLPYVVSDSRATTRIDEPVGLAAEVFEAGAPASRTGRVEGQRVARVARPVDVGGQVRWVAVWTRDLEDVGETVGLIRAQALLGGGAALLIALVGSWLVARGVTRRVRRLEAAARHVASGSFPGPLPLDSDDELGQLTRTFNEMQAQLSQVDRARKDFIATASHELRTPIFSLGGFVELLRDEDLDDATRHEFLATMAEQIERLQKLAVDLLDLSRLDAGTLELRPERIDVAELARGVTREFHPQVKDRPGRVELRVGDEPVEAVCDPERVAQIVRILLDNALRHTPEGTHVTVGAARADGEVSVSVVDRGPGVDDDAVPHLFDRFYTGDATRGSGLGLAIARELAELMDGRIEVRSGTGETVFTLGLPAA
jgi:signal transduction histidine kinase